MCRVLCQDEFGPSTAFEEHSSLLMKVEVLVREKRMSRREPGQGEEGRVDMQRKENRSKKALSIIYTQCAIIFKYVFCFES